MPTLRLREIFVSLRSV